MNIKNISLIMIFMSMISCADSKLGALVIDPEFEPYVNRFISLSKKTNHPVNSANVEIQFDDKMDSQTIGICYTGSMQIKINSKSWATLSQISREIVLFHELGHCILHRDHLDTKVLTSDTRAPIPVSIMRPALMYAPFYEINYDAYISELFDGDRGIVYLTRGDSKFNSAYYTASTKPKQAAAKSSATEIRVDSKGEVLSLHCGE